MGRKESNQTNKQNLATALRVPEHEILTPATSAQTIPAHPQSRTRALNARIHKACINEVSDLSLDMYSSVGYISMGVYATSTCVKIACAGPYLSYTVRNGVGGVEMCEGTGLI